MVEMSEDKMMVLTILERYPYYPDSESDFIETVRQTYKKCVLDYVEKIMEGLFDHLEERINISRKLYGI